MMMRNILYILMAVALLTGCKTEYVPIETTKTEIHHTRDSVHHTDSIIKEKQVTIMQLDSAEMAKYGIKLANAERAWLVMQKELENRIKMLSEHKTDTFVKNDTISVPYPVERKQTAWERTMQNVGKISLIILVTSICFMLVYLLLRARNKIL